MSKTYIFTDENGYYSHELDGVDGELPPFGAILSPPPPGAWPKVWPRWTGTEWELIADHRKREYDRAQEATEYWLHDDTWDSPARIMTEIGPLPDGAMLVAPKRDPMEALTSAQEQALTRIDAAAETERAKYITSGAGQAMVYQQKQAEAHAYTANPSGTYPHLQAEIGITGRTLEEVAQTVLAMEAGWTRVSATIEAARLSAKAAIRACTTVEAVDQVLDSLRWSNP